ncbi:MAG: GNAT family N-acetyltransferase [Marmoricola sp.]
MELRIRVGTPADAVVASGLLRAFNHEFASPVPDSATLVARFERILAESTVMAVLAEISEPVGFALITLRPTPYYDGPLAQLDELYVVPELRGSGIGTRILTQAIELLKDRGVGEMHINVDEVDEAARRFYERHGFVNIEPGTDYRMLCYLREF